MVCVDSGDIIEFHDEIIETRQEEIAKKHGFKLVDHSMVLYVKRLNNTIIHVMTKDKEPLEEENSK